MFIHTVYFWLGDDAGDDVRRRMLADCTELLSKIPSARHVWAGGPAMTPRDVVDNSYTIGLCTVFDDSKGHDEYQVHPLHREFGRRYKQYWKKVQIYDFL
jgi:hypothetical protein